MVTGETNAPTASCIPGIAGFLFVNEYNLFKGNVGALLNLYHRVKDTRAAKIVIFQPSVRLSLFLSLTGIPTYALYPVSRKRPRHLRGGAPWEPLAPRYVAEQYLALAQEAGGVPDGVQLDFLIPPDAPSAETLVGGRERRHYVVVAPGGGVNPRDDVPAKRPPEALFAAVIHDLVHQFQRKVVLVGGPPDKPRCDALAAGHPDRVVNLAGQTNVAALGRVIEGAHYVVTTDSLPLHIAVALGKKFIALFSCTSPRSLLPAALLPEAVTSPVDCAPCYSNAVFPGCRNRAKFVCRETIPIDAVRTLIRKYEGRRGP